jgi:hypothetical protein
MASDFIVTWQFSQREQGTDVPTYIVIAAEYCPLTPLASFLLESDRIVNSAGSDRSFLKVILHTSSPVGVL